MPGFEFFDAKSWKKSSDCSSKGYNDNVRTIEVRGKGLSTNLPGGAKAEITSKFTNKGESCSTESTIKLTGANFTLSNTINSCSNYKYELTANLDDQVPGLKFGAKGDNSGGRSGNCPFSSSRLSFTYAQDAFMIEAGVDPLKNNALDVAVAGGADGIAAGIRARYSLGESKLTCYGLGLGYQTDALQFLLNAGADKSKESCFYGFNAISASIHHELIRDRLCFAAEYGKCASSEKTSTSLAAVYSADSRTTLRAKVNDEGTLVMAGDFKNSDFSTINLTARVNAKTFDGAAFGWGLTFEK